VKQFFPVLYYELLRAMRKKLFILGVVLCWIMGTYFSLFLLGSFNQVLQRASRSSQIMQVSVPRFEEYVLSSFLHSMSFVLVLFIPFLVMEVVGAEREQGTLAVYKLAGKSGGSYLVLRGFVIVALVALLVLCTLCFPILMTRIVSFSMTPIYSAGVVLMAGLFYFCGLTFLVATLTARASSAGLIGFLLVLVLYSASTLEEFFPPTWFAVIDMMSPGKLWREGFLGLLSLNDVISFVLLGALFFLFGTVVLKHRQEVW
jgi:ABC-2 type transport system permease protein